MMDESGDDAGQALRDSADRLFTSLLTPAQRRAADHGAFPAEAWAALEDAGLPAALLPEEAGGFGAAPADALSLLRVAGAHALPLPLADTMLAAWLLASAGLQISPGPIALGQADLALQCTSGWHVAGPVHGVPWGRNATALVLLLDQQVVCARPAIWQVEVGLAIDGTPRDILHLDGPVEIARAPVTALQLRAAGAATRTNAIAGALEATLATTVQYANDRVQFGKPIGRLQAIQQTIAILANQAAAAAAAAAMAADAFAPVPAPLRIAAAKARASEAAGIGAAIAHQVHGAIGFTEEYHLHRLTRRLYAWRDEYGNEVEWTRHLGRHLASAGPDHVWEAITAL